MEKRNQNTKVIAMYLPQYHEIPENNEWWGKGFTEWTNVKKAEPIFRGHYQPRVPMNDNYYDLSNPSIMQEQMKLARENGIDGFCIYHYWFKGKKLLEKPVEQLLKADTVELPFCLCWANEPWTRTWDGIAGSKHVLIDQDYGNISDWKKHYQYLAEFFKMNEYIKIDNKPVFVIYKETDIDNCRMMLEYWNCFAMEDGFNGLFIVCARREDVFSKQIYGDAIFDFEPFATISSLTEEQRTLCCKYYFGNRPDNEDLSYPVYDCDKVCEKMVSRYVMKSYKHYLGMFAGWDNTARRGVNANGIFENMTVDVFKKYFMLQYKRSIELENEFMFINAWNEWGEGTYLEPDSKYGLGFLDAIRNGKEEVENA